MGFPTATTQTSQAVGNTTTPTATFPAASAGDLIIAIMAQDGAGTFTWPGAGATWQEIADHAFTGGTTHIAYLIAASGETSVTPTSTLSERSNHIVLSIPAATWHGTTPPEVTIVSTATTLRNHCHAWLDRA